jgi:hypothetical protein
VSIRNTDLLRSAAKVLLKLLFDIKSLIFWWVISIYGEEALWFLPT